jgi:hypothetical protein
MAVRYFNIKEGSEKVFGGVIEVNTSAELEKRVQDFYEDGSYEFKHLSSTKTRDIYRLRIPDIKYSSMPARDAIGGRTNVAAPYEAGRATMLEIAITQDGELKLHKMPKNKKIFVNEISAKKARELKEGKVNWDLTRAYIAE